MSINESEAQRILAIMGTADHGCSSCVKRLYSLFLKNYPQYKNLVSECWKKLFPETYDEMSDEDWEKEIRLLEWD